MYASGVETKARRTNPVTGKPQLYPVRVRPENIAAAMAVEIGIPTAEIAGPQGGISERVRESVLPEVDEATSTGEPEKVVLLHAQDWDET